MLFHLSIVAQNPKKVTCVLAELMGGESQPFPAVEQAWIAFANDSLGTAIEVYPLTTVLKSFTNLTTLILGNYSNIKSENICELEKIETLDLWESQNFDYGNIGSIITKFPKIKILIDKENLRHLTKER